MPNNLPLWTHQERAIDRALHYDGFYINHDMGIGKTRTAIEYSRRVGAKTILVVCPYSAIEVWMEELNKYLIPHQYRAVPLDRGSSVNRAARLSSALSTNSNSNNALYVLVNYEAIWRNKLASVIRATKWDLLICDEAHRLKSPGTKQSLFMRNIARHIKRRLLLSGTPMPNGPQDIYGQFVVMDHRIFGTRLQDFQNRYIVFGGFENREIKAYKNMTEFQGIIGAYMDTQKADDAIDLPPFTIQHLIGELEPKARAAYSHLETAFIAMVDKGMVTTNNALTQLLRLEQLTGGHLALDDGSICHISNAKKNLLVDYLMNTAEDESVVVFAKYLADLDSIHAAANSVGKKSLELSGRKKELGRWSKGEAPVLAVQISTGSEAIDLTRARQVVYYSIGFSMRTYAQSRARIRRQGQKARNVLYTHLMVKDTVDERILTALAGKKALSDVILQREIVSDVLRKEDDDLIREVLKSYMGKDTER